jgi:hypothetical protein
MSLSNRRKFNKFHTRKCSGCYERDLVGLSVDSPVSKFNSLIVIKEVS